MSIYSIEPATEGDNEALCSLCAIPMKGDISLSFERAPNFFAGSAIQCESTEVYVCRRNTDGSIYGVFSVGKRKVFYQNEIQYIRYFSDLRIHPNVQGARVLYLIARFITDNNLLGNSFAQTIVFADNTPMLSLVDSLNHRAGKLSIFKYYPAGNFRSYMVKFSRYRVAANEGLHVRKASEHDANNMNAFLRNNGTSKNFFPYYDFNQLSTAYHKGLMIDNFYLALHNEEIVGIAGVWDQKTIKQTKIQSYSKFFSAVRPLVNLYSSVSGSLTLPSPGTVLNYLVLHCMLVKDNDPMILKKLLQIISNEYAESGYDYFLIGFDERDSFNNALSIFKHKRLIKGKHFLVSNNALSAVEVLSSPYYLETARI